MRFPSFWVDNYISFIKVGKISVIIIQISHSAPFFPLFFWDKYLFIRSFETVSTLSWGAFSLLFSVSFLCLLQMIEILLICLKNYQHYFCHLYSAIMLIQWFFNLKFHIFSSNISIWLFWLYFLLLYCFYLFILHKFIFFYHTDHS